MSFQTLYHEVSINKDQLLNLFLGRGDLLITLASHKITLNAFNDRNLLRVGNGVDLHSVKIRGVSDDQTVAYVDGKGTIKPTTNNETFKLSLELHLQDYFE